MNDGNSVALGEQHAPEIDLDENEAAALASLTGTTDSGTEKNTDTDKPDEGNAPAADTDGQVNDGIIVVDGVKPAEDNPTDWKPVTDLFGVNVENPDRDSVLRAIEDKIIADKYPYIKEFETNPEGKAMLDFIKAGGTRAEYFNVTNVYDKALLLNDDEMLSQIVKNSGDKSAEVEKKYSEMTPEQRTAEAARLREIIDGNRKKSVENLFNESRENRQKMIEQAKAEAQINDKAVTQEIMKLEKLYDVKLDENTKKALADKWNSGEYKKQFAEDPAFVAKAVATLFTAESTFKSMLANIYKASNEGSEKVKEAVLRYLHQIPPKKDAPDAGSKDTKKPNGEHPLAGLDLDEGQVEIEFVK